MDLGLDPSTILAFVFGLIALYIVGMLLVIPIKILTKLIWNAIVGGVLLLLANVVGGFIGITIAINPITAIVVGFLGVPAIVVLFIMQVIL